MKTKKCFIIAVNLFLSLLLVNLQSCETEELITGTVEDPDGRTYITVVIGDQTWMAENLAYIPHVSHPGEDGGIWVYDYDGNYVETAKKTNNYKKYGCLYNWEMAKSSCPDGWHLPSDEEWKTMEKSFGMSQSEADKTGWRGLHEGYLLKSENLWLENGGGVENSLFEGLPGGLRYSLPYSRGFFEHIGRYGDWWTATETSDTTAWSRGLHLDYDQVYRGKEDKEGGRSVRCIKD